MNRELAESVLALANARDEYEDASAELAIAQAAFEAEHANLIQRVAGIRKRIAEIEATIRAYPASAEERSPAPGITIRMMTRMAYSEDEARNWALNSGLAELLKIDKQAFEKVAEGLRLKFVKIEKVPTVTIARDLSKVRDEVSNAIWLESMLAKQDHRSSISVPLVTNWDQDAERAATADEKSA